MGQQPDKANEENGPLDEERHDPKYNLTVHGDVSGLTVGDQARVTQAFGASGQPAPGRDPLDGPAYAAARARYLEALGKRYGVVTAHSLALLAEDEHVGTLPSLPLLGQEGVYVPLAFDPPAAHRELMEGRRAVKEEALLREMAQREPRPLALGEVLALPGHLAIIGDAGSGKTTLLHVLVTALAAPSGVDFVPPELARALPEPRPLPVLLPLRLFEHACGRERYQRTVAGLLRFLDDWFNEWCPAAELPPDFLADHVRAGRAWLLLDALDEVADPKHRRTVRNAILGLAQDFSASRFIVTARVAGYRDARLDQRFTVVHVRDLDKEQRAQMVRAIYGGLALVNAARRADDLIGRFQELEALRQLGRTPVMVWTAAVIHALRGQLPESRGALYDAYVDILLRQTYELGLYDTQSLEELSDRLGWRLEERRQHLTYAAFQVHCLLEDQPERRGDRRLIVGEDELADYILTPYFRDHLMLRPHEARSRARAYLGLMVARSGLLFETPQGYTVGDHLTMQEFLAGCYLGYQFQLDDPDGYRTFLEEKVTATWWREVFLLAAGYLAGQPSFAAVRFMKQIAAQGETPDGRLAALALAAGCLLQLRLQRQRPGWYDGLARELAGDLYARLYAKPLPAPAALRQEAGLALGLLYGFPGEGGLSDPRFAHPAGLPDFVPVAAGGFWMGDDESRRENERPCHRVDLDPFEIARYPTINAMLARFISAGGYRDPRWWPEAIAADVWNEQDGFRSGNLPRNWDDAGLNNPAQPVVGVSWYEAVAYCRWLTATLDDGHLYHLPSEAQWERAARGSFPSPGGGGARGGGRYPWGNEWQEDHCNSRESGLGAPSPVGVFPRGAAHGGVHDMVGNVYEWCQDWYDADYYAQSGDARDPAGPEAGEYRVLRGGGWASNGPDICRCGFRLWDLPGGGLDVVGFRCARTLS